MFLCSLATPLFSSRNAEAATGLSKLAVIGDSLTDGSLKYGDFQNKLNTNSGWSTSRVDAKIGRQIPSTAQYKSLSGVHTLRSIRSSGYNPDAVVVALGTNDIGFGSTEQQYRNWIEEMMNEIGDLPVLWVNVYREDTATRKDRTVLFNKMLTQVSLTRKNLKIYDWASIIKMHSNWWYSDKVHLNTTGYLNRSQLLTDQIREMLPKKVAPPVRVAGLSGFESVSPTRIANNLITDPKLTTVISIPASGSNFNFHSAFFQMHVDRASSKGYGLLWDCSTPQPTTSSINFDTDIAVSVGTISAVSASNEVCFRSSSSVRLSVDYTGYFSESSINTFSQERSRIVDSRQDVSKKLQPGQPIEIQVSTNTNRQITAVSLLVTSVKGQQLGELSVWGCNENSQSTDTKTVSVNVDGSPATAATIIGSDGYICVSSNVETDFIIDLTGEWSDSPLGLRYQQITPLRIADTRSGLGGWFGTFDDLIQYQYSTEDYAPITVKSLYISGVSLGDGESNGWTSVNSCTNQSLFPIVQYGKSSTRAGTGAVPLDASTRSFCVRSSSRTRVVLDINGWYE